jgi:hypothetical protein
MPVLQINGELKIVRLSIKLTEFPSLLKQHLDSDPETIKMEKLGIAYIANGFKLNETEEFVRKVCKWGNYAGVAGSVLKHNALDFIQQQLKKAYEFNLSDNFLEAITSVKRINCLAVSFGSKHLKFLNPDRAVVLDRIISERLGYPHSELGYVEFLKECISIRDILNNANVVASAPHLLWRVSDVEMAIFMRLREQ